MFSIPLASPFCIFYRTGLTPYPSSLNASNIRTLLAHRFHLLKLLVIINYILIVVKHNLFIILYEPFSLILVKTILFFLHLEHILTLILLVIIYFSAAYLLVILSLLFLLHIKNQDTFHMSHHIYLRYRHEFFRQFRACSSCRNSYIKQTTMKRCWKMNISTFRIRNNIY